MSLTKVSYSMINGEFANVLDFGAIGDGVADDTTAIQAAIDSQSPVHGTVYFPAGTYKVTGTGLSVSGGAAGTVQLVGAGQSASKIRNTNGNVLRVQGELMSVSDIAFWSDGGGHTIVQTGIVAQCQFNRVMVIQTATGFSLWNNAGNEYIDNRWRDCFLQHVSGATVPGFHLVSAGGDINDNVWQDTRVLYSGNYFFWVESTGANWQYHNQFRNINFEVCNGGGIKLISNAQYEIANCANWDAQVVGPITQDFYDLARNASSITCYGVINNCGRWAGVNDVGIFDIDLPDGGGGAGTVITLCSSSSTLNSFSANLRSNSAVLIADKSTFSADNATNAVWVKNGYLITPYISITDGITAPATVSGQSFLYVDAADGDLKIKFGDGTVKTIVTDS